MVTNAVTSIGGHMARRSSIRILRRKTATLRSWQWGGLAASVTSRKGQRKNRSRSPRSLGTEAANAPHTADQPGGQPRHSSPSPPLSLTARRRSQDVSRSTLPAGEQKLWSRYTTEQKGLALPRTGNDLVALCPSPMLRSKNRLFSSPGVEQPDAFPGNKSLRKWAVHFRKIF